MIIGLRFQKGPKPVPHRHHASLHHLANITNERWVRQIDAAMAFFFAVAAAFLAAG
jgi:hypothetical protein